MLSYLNASYCDGSSNRNVKGEEIFQSNPAYCGNTQLYEKEAIWGDYAVLIQL